MDPPPFSSAVSSTVQAQAASAQVLLSVDHGGDDTVDLLGGNGANVTFLYFFNERINSPDSISLKRGGFCLKLVSWKLCYQRSVAAYRRSGNTKGVGIW